MRIIDLIDFIRSTSQLYYKQSLPDVQRLAMLKRSFPRPDLIRWFDTCVPIELPASRYMPYLLMSAATLLHPPNRPRIQYGSSADLTLFAAIKTPKPGTEVSLGLDELGRARHDTVSDSLAEQTGLIQGIVDYADAVGLANLVRFLTLRAPHARRLWIVAEHLFDEYTALTHIWQGHLIYQGPLQFWPGQTTSVVFRSPINPIEERR